MAVVAAVFVAVPAITVIEEITFILVLFPISIILFLWHVVQAILFQSPSTIALSSLV